jgi:hypothetical protein
MGRHTIGPASSGLVEGLAGRDVLVPSRTSGSCGGPGAVHVDTVARCTGVSSDTVLRLTSGLSGHCVKKQCGLVGFQGTHGSLPLSLPSPYGSCSDETRLTTNWIPRNGGKGFTHGDSGNKTK